MKKFTTAIFTVALSLFLVVSCNNDDDTPPLPPPPAPVTITADNFTADLSAGSQDGTVVGQVVGSASEGAVTFAIATQTPAGVLAITNAGELSVANSMLLEAGTSINADVTVSQGDVSETATVAITVTECCDSSADTSIWEGDITSITQTTFFGDDITFVTRDVIGVAGENTITLTGDIAGKACLEQATEFTLTPDFEGATTGTVVAELQDYVCAFSDGTYEASGTYDETTGEITIEYTSITEFSETTGTSVISLAKPDADGDGVADADDTAPNDACMPMQEPGYVLYDDRVLAWQESDCDGDGVSNNQEIFDFTDPYDETSVVVPDADGDGVADADDPAPDDPCVPAQDPGYFGYDFNNFVWGDADCDGDGFINDEEDRKGSDPYDATSVPAPDADGDGVSDPDDSEPNDPCVPVQVSGYFGFDAGNAMWSQADCDGDGVSNGDEWDINFTDPYDAASN